MVENIRIWIAQTILFRLSEEIESINIVISEKGYIDSLIVTLNTEVLNSKKIKKGDYFVMIYYEIGTDGVVNVKNVTPSPESSYLQEQIKERINIKPPRLNPITDANGKARKVNKKYNLNISKD